MLDAPAWAALKSANVETVATLGPSGNSKVKLQSTIIIPPFMARSILEVDSYNTLTLIPIVSNSMQTFDKDSEVKSCSRYRHTLYFLYSVYKVVAGTIIAAVDESKEGAEWSKDLHSLYVASATENIRGIPSGL
jgi:hypothetical protein